MASPNRCELVSWEQFHVLARTLAMAIHDASFQPDAIVAISRGGCTPARVLCDYLDVFDLDVVKIEHYHGTRKEKIARLRYPMSADVNDRKVLLVDDVSDTGDSFELAIQHLLERGQPASLRTAVLHHKTVSSYTPDFYAEVVQQWRWIIYPWAVMEDLRSLVPGLDRPELTVDEAAQYIKEKHGLAISVQLLQDLFTFSGSR